MQHETFPVLPEHVSGGEDYISALEDNAPIQLLLIETMDAYEQSLYAGGPMVGDYAAFASQSLGCFKSRLNNPDLTSEDLALILRRCFRLQKARGGRGQRRNATLSCIKITWLLRPVDGRVSNGATTTYKTL